LGIVNYPYFKPKVLMCEKQCQWAWRPRGSLGGQSQG